MPNERAQSGISCFDVSRLIREIERFYGGKVAVHIHVPVREVSGVALDVRAVFTRGGGTSDSGYYERGSSSPWPTGKSTTLTGLIFRLLYELEGKLSEEKAEAERLTQLRFDD